MCFRVMITRRVNYMAKRLKNELVTGNRSQAEAIIIDLLRFHFKKLKVLPNDKSAIGKELDIFLPELSAAIEVDGPTHFEPIFGEDKLKRTQERDRAKEELCEQKGIHLFRIKLPKDSSNYFTAIKKELCETLIPELKTLQGL